MAKQHPLVDTRRLHHPFPRLQGEGFPSYPIETPYRG